MRWKLSGGIDTDKWHRWFAWRPVKLQDGWWAWLEYVDRCAYYGWFRTWWEYSAREP